MNSSKILKYKIKDPEGKTVGCVMAFPPSEGNGADPSFGYAMCSKADLYNKAIGEKLCLERAKGFKTFGAVIDYLLKQTQRFSVVPADKGLYLEKIYNEFSQYPSYQEAVKNAPRASSSKLTQVIYLLYCLRERARAYYK